MIKGKKQQQQQQRCWIVEACSTKCDVKYCRTQNRILEQRLAEQRQKFLAKLQNRILSQRLAEQRQKFLPKLQNRILSQRLVEQRQKFLAKVGVASRDDMPPRFSPP